MTTNDFSIVDSSFLTAFPTTDIATLRIPCICLIHFDSAFPGYGSTCQYTKEAVNQRRELRDLKGELKMMIDHENEDDDTVTLERLEFMATEANFDIEKLPDLVSLVQCLL